MYWQTLLIHFTTWLRPDIAKCTQSQSLATTNLLNSFILALCARVRRIDEARLDI